ncbi:MAG TPA: hypothetical protein VMV94_13220 [Phycisphaerae bacterium]|nr:hypothetical protein [Phycisphaerae bacterium]
MTTIAGKNDLPDFSDVRPLIRADDLTGLNQAIEQFESTLTAFNAAVNDAEKTVSLTLAWIGVGEKLLNLAGVILQKWPVNSEQPAQPGTGIGKLADRLGELGSLCAAMAKSLPTTSA